MARGTIMGAHHRQKAKMRAKVDRKKGAFISAFMANEQPIAEAATRAMEDVADLAKRGGRTRIASAGFSQKWQKALRADVYPKGGRASINAAAHVYHKISYAMVFEEGATLKGRPMMWLPLPTAPKKVARMAMTPKRYIENIGPLHSINRPGKSPLLAASVGMSRAAAKRGKVKRLSTSALRRGYTGRGQKVQRSVPMFVGIRTTQIRQKFNITGAINQAAKQAGALYVKHLKVDD